MLKISNCTGREVVKCAKVMLWRAQLTSVRASEASAVSLHLATWVPVTSKKVKERL